MAQTRKTNPKFSNRPSPQESRFIIEYLKDSNGPRAAISTGWCDKDKPQQARKIAEQILAQPRVIAAIKEQLDASAQRELITVDRIMQEVYRLATYNAQEAFDAAGSPLPITELPEDLARAIEGFETEEVRGKPGVWVTKYKFAKKAVSQALLLERIDDVVKRFELTGKGGAPLNASKVDLSDVSIELLKRIVEKGNDQKV